MPFALHTAILAFVTISFAMLAGCAVRPQVADSPNASPLWLREPRVHLQLRSGATGGNPVTMTMSGQTSIYVDRVTEQPLPMTLPVDIHEQSLAHVIIGGLIPKGRIFRIEKVTFFGTSAGDSNGNGTFIVRVGKSKIVEQVRTARPVRDQWLGQIDIPAGQESSVVVEISNSSLADVLIEGQFLDPPLPGGDASPR